MAKFVLDINGAISPDQSAYASEWGVVSLGTVKQALKNIADDHDSLEIRINSPGGVVDEGFAIINEILMFAEDKKLSITTVATGQVASIATAIFLMAKTRKVLSTSQLFVHNPFIDPFALPWEGVEAKDLEEIAVWLRQEETRIVNYVVAQSGADESVVRELMNNKTTIASDQALELKFATEIYEPAKNMRGLILNKFNNHKKEKQMSNPLKKLAADALAKLNSAAKQLGITMNISGTTKDGKTLEFSTETIEVGADVTIDGVVATDGSYEMEDGSIVVVKDGKVESITPADNSGTGTEDLQNQNNELTTENARLTGEVTELTEVVNQLVTTTNNLTASLVNMKTGFKPENRGQGASGTDKKTDAKNEGSASAQAVARAKAKADEARKKAQEETKNK